MNKIYILIAGIVVVLFGASFEVSAQSLVDTKWHFENEYNCSSYLSFEADSITIYDCETNEKIFGTFKIDADTIRVQTIRGEFDNNFPADSKHRHKPYSFKLLRQEDKLIDLKYGLTYKKTNK